MSNGRFGVGIVGLQPGRSWAALAHVPALRALASDFEIVGVANTSLVSAQAAAAACGLSRAFADVAELVACPDVDIVAVTVKVPHHFEIVKAAIAAGKHVYCEWPLGNGLAEAQQLATLATRKGVLGVIGTQARVAPEIEYLRRLIDEDFIGEVLSTTLLGWGEGWGATIPHKATYAYLLDRANGATMLTIPLGHTLAALRDVLGDIVELSAILANRRTAVFAADTGEMLPMTAHDQAVIGGRLENGAPLAIHYRGGMPRGEGLIWMINGAKGDIRVTGAQGHSQLTQLFLESIQEGGRAWCPLEVPGSYREDWPNDAVSGNVARVYARMAADLRSGSRTAPSFDDAVRLHELLAAIEAAAEHGQRVMLK
ncbi:oxidoreductase [Steroidobacter denitrificans]|uniref:Oxidoreductase n=1 Tax=Steroidobacter denitrificans TaxID=465721 RepID=A0A127F654_STEDE|nr:Gfo/Idh/MocA family oxidoreductase [Steroidobacter denitrificans]AMN45922.1 oxidoreductase [Steroidobacter denitrificans]